jgi:hypothetical protein
MAFLSEIHGFWVIFGSLKIALPAFVRLRRLSVALLQNLPKSRAGSLILFLLH